MYSKIVVTGGAGFIGSNLAIALQEKYPETKIVVLDNFLVGHFKNLRKFKGQVIAADILHFDWNSLGKVDAIFHEAAITDTTVMDQKHMINVNTNAFERLLHHCLKNKIKLIYASSAATYGNTAPPMIEWKNQEPANIYGYSKLLMDQRVKEILDNSPDAEIVGLRYFNVYGPHEQFKGKMASMIWQLYGQMKEGKKPRIFKHGEQKRDFVYIKDVVHANLCALDGSSGIFNVGAGRAEDFNTIIAELNKNMELKLKTEYIDNPYDFFQDHTLADLSEAAMWGYAPSFNLETGIKDYVDWIKREGL